MERAEGLLGGKFLFNRQNYGTIDKTKAVCSICQIEFSYHRAQHVFKVIRIASGDNLPPRGTIVSRIHSLYDGERARKIQLLAQTASVVLTGEHWTSVSNDKYLGVTAHFIDNVWKLRYFALEVKKNRGATYSGGQKKKNKLLIAINLD